MTPEERACEATLLEQRWLLIQGGADRKSIKIRKHHLYLNDRLHGQVINPTYQLAYNNASFAVQVDNNGSDDFDRDSSSDVPDDQVSDHSA